MSVFQVQLSRVPGLGLHKATVRTSDGTGTSDEVQVLLQTHMFLGRIHFFAAVEIMMACFFKASRRISLQSATMEFSITSCNCIMMGSVHFHVLVSHRFHADSKDEDHTRVQFTGDHTQTLNWKFKAPDSSFYFSNFSGALRANLSTISYNLFFLQFSMTANT